MIIHLTGSTTNLKKDLPYLRAIVKTIAENDSVLARDWIESAYHAKETGKLADKDVDWRQVMDETMDAIHRADITIIESTNYTFSQGFQVAVALQQKKPTLIVSRKPLNERMISGYRNKMLSMKEYKTEEDLAEITRQFIRDNTIATKDLRFNMFIDRPIYNYLRSESYESGKNKSEIIRDLINKEIEKKS